MKRKRELYDDDLKLRPWASIEIEFVNSNLNKMDCLATGTNAIVQDIQYVFHHCRNDLMLQALGAMGKHARQESTLSKDTKQKEREHQ